MNRFVTARQLQGWYRIRDVHYDPVEVWSTFQSPNSDRSRDVIGGFFTRIAVLALWKLFPSKPADNRQEDYLADILAHLYIYFMKDIEKRVLSYFPNPPTTLSLQKRFHAHFLNKAKNIFVDLYRKEKVQQAHDEEIEAAANTYLGKELTGLDEDISVPLSYLTSKDYFEFANHYRDKRYYEGNELYDERIESTPNHETGLALAHALESWGLLERAFVIDFNKIHEEMLEREL
jgi:hypothetical protein